MAAAGRQWRLTRAADLEELWDAMTADPHNFEDERLPYWTELWPSSVALAGWLAARQEEIAGRVCLDLGCGLGLTALVGQWLGALQFSLFHPQGGPGLGQPRHRGLCLPPYRRTG